MDFQQRLEKAIQRGQEAGTARAAAEAQRALSEKELQRLHAQYRLQLSEHIERCLREVADHFPGFRFQTVVDERGWGAVISRDDLRLRPRSPRESFFSRLEIVVRPISPSFVLELAGKCTVCNKELFSRSHYQRLGDVDLASFTSLIDLWVLEFAERYAAES